MIHSYQLPPFRHVLAMLLAVFVGTTSSQAQSMRDVDDHSDDHGHMVLFETQFRPNQPGGDDKGLSAPHEGIGQFALCDGSVTAISENIDAGVFNAPGTGAGGEVVGEF